MLDTPGGDPRATTPGVQAIAAAAPDHAIALGAAFGPADQLARRVATAGTGALLGGGGQLVFPQVPGVPGKKYVALYGTPGSKALGVLGEQDVPATLARADATAAPYRTLTTDAVVPAVEIIATIASAGPGDDGNYSQERSVEELRPLVEAAGAAGMAVVLDLQPGRTDFLTQAQQYADLLALPYVGLALDPEWRLAPDQVHLRQIGSVGIDEVNGVVGVARGLHRAARAAAEDVRPAPVRGPDDPRTGPGSTPRATSWRWSSTSTGRARSRRRRAPGTRCARTRRRCTGGGRTSTTRTCPCWTRRRRTRCSRCRTWSATSSRALHQERAAGGVDHPLELVCSSVSRATSSSVSSLRGPRMLPTCAGPR